MKNSVIEVDFKSKDSKEKKMNPDLVFAIATILIVGLNVFNYYLYKTL